MSKEVPENWPRCHWCGEPLGELSIEVETSRNERRTVCRGCREIIGAIIAEDGPYHIGEFLTHYSDTGERMNKWPHHRDLDVEDIEKLRGVC